MTDLLTLDVCTVGRRHGMEAVMLTVMNANSDAAALYHRLGYVMDESSPSACDAADDCGYEILTKKLAPRPTPGEHSPNSRL